jgi:glycine C-acetyltransferase
LREICDLAEQYNAIVMVDDSHGVGVMGIQGRGVHEHAGVIGRVDVLTGTLGKALGGGMGGYTAGPKPIIDLLRQRSRPYLFSNSLAPAVVAASIAALKLLQSSQELQGRLRTNTVFFRSRMTELGLNIIPGEHPIVPVMIGDAAKAARMAEYLLERGIYVVGFSYPVVPMGKARIRTQVSAAHTEEELERAAKLFHEAAAAVS